MAREMKDSGIAWIGEIPADWDVSQVKYSLKWKSEKGQAKGNVLSLYRDYGVIPKDSRDDNYNVTSLDTSGYKVVDIGDFVINKMKAWQGSMSVSEYRGIISPAYHVCEFTNNKVHKKYFHYLMRNRSYIPEYTRLSTGMRIGQWDLGFNDFKNIPFLLPPKKEQQEIANYLDQKCSEFDNVLEQTRASIAEYKKLKQAVITQAVTKGIRGDRKMKDSGIVWIGEIPIGWEISQVKYSLKWKSEKGQPQEEVLSLYRDFGIVPKDSRGDNHNVTSLDTSGYKVVDIGDFVINKMKAWQGSMAISEYRGIISPAYHVCEFINDKLNKKYFHYLMRNKSYIPEYTRLSTGMRVGQWDLGFDDFKNIPFLLPPQEEQKEIVNYLDKKCSAIDDLIAKKAQYLSEIENYKKSLIYEYVTGKKEVPREYQA